MDIRGIWVEDCRWIRQTDVAVPLCVRIVGSRRWTCIVGTIAAPKCLHFPCRELFLEESISQAPSRHYAAPQWTVYVSTHTLVNYTWYLCQRIHLRALFITRQERGDGVSVQGFASTRSRD
jgi:hypothetical protein